MKYSKALAKKILIVGTIFGIMVGIFNKVQKKIPDYKVSRPDYGEDAATYDLIVDDGNQKVDISVDVEPKQYQESEIEGHMDNVEESLQEKMKGENISLNQVRKDLNLITAIEGESISIQWYSSDYRLVDFNGTVHNEDLLEQEQKTCVLYAQLSYQKHERRIEIPVTVLAPERTQQEQSIMVMKRIVDDAVKNNLTDSEITLPKELNGKKVTYINKKNRVSAVAFPLLAAMVVAVLYCGNILEEKKRTEHRRIQLQYDYSEVISKLTLLVGAGMTFRKAWEKIVHDYRGNKKNKKRYVYEEMEHSLCEMEAGVSELEVYESFGKRCDSKEYVKLATLLQQNLKKGSKGLADLLQLEAREAFQQRKNLAVQRGEEAGTKLLLPMIMMLAVVMAIVMVPAFLSFQM